MATMCVFEILVNRLCMVVDSNAGQVFLNIVLDEAVEEKPGGEKVRIGMVV